MRLPSVRLGWFWNQWFIGVMYDDRNIMGTRWVVLFVGPLTVSLSFGRIP